MPPTQAKPSVSGQSQVEMKGRSQPSSIALSTRAQNGAVSTSSRATQSRVQPQLVPMSTWPHSASSVQPRIVMTSAKKIGSHCEQSSITPVVEDPVLDEPVLDASVLDEPVLDASALDEPVLDRSVVAWAVVVEVDGPAVDVLAPESEPLPEVSVEAPLELAPPLLLADDALPLSVALVAPGPPQAERERRRAAVKGRRAGRIGSGADPSGYREDYKELGRGPRPDRRAPRTASIRGVRTKCSDLAASLRSAPKEGSQAVKRSRSAPQAPRESVRGDEARGTCP